MRGWEGATAHTLIHHLLVLFTRLYVLTLSSTPHCPAQQDPQKGVTDQQSNHSMGHSSHSSSTGRSLITVRAGHLQADKLHHTSLIITGG